MLRYIEKENKKLGFKYKDYYLPQGDSFSLTATEQGSEEGVDVIPCRYTYKVTDKPVEVEDDGSRI